MEKQNYNKVKRIAREHGLTVQSIGTGYQVINRSLFSGTSVQSFRSLVSLVDYLKPILRDDELFGMYC